MSVIIQIRDTFYGLDLQPASDVRRHTLEKNRSFFSIHENYLIKNWFHWHFENDYGRTIGIIIIDLLLTVQSFIHFVRHDSLTCQTKFKKTYFEFWDEIFFFLKFFLKHFRCHSGNTDYWAALCFIAARWITKCFFGSELLLLQVGTSVFSYDAVLATHIYFRSSSGSRSARATSHTSSFNPTCSGDFYETCNLKSLKVRWVSGGPKNW